MERIRDFLMIVRTYECSLNNNINKNNNNGKQYLGFRERILQPFIIHGGTSLPHVHLKQAMEKPKFFEKSF